MSDVYYSRLLAIARQNKGIRFIRNIENNQILVELDNGNISTLPFEEVINYKNSDEKNVETI
jgi:hypothetical protein